MHLGYIVNTHYQSLLPLVEDNTLPEWLAQPAIDNTLQRTLQCLQSLQGSQVSFSQDNISHPSSTSTEYSLIFLAPGTSFSPNQPGHIKPVMWQ